MTEQLITEGLGSIVSSHTLEDINDKTIKGLLRDQEAALEMVFNDIKNNKPLTHSTIKTWHKLITRHQMTVTGIALKGEQAMHVSIPFEHKGEYKISNNNPLREDGCLV